MVLPITGPDYWWIDTDITITVSDLFNRSTGLPLTEDATVTAQLAGVLGGVVSSITLAYDSPGTFVGSIPDTTPLVAGSTYILTVTADEDGVKAVSKVTKVAKYRSQV